MEKMDREKRKLAKPPVEEGDCFEAEIIGFGKTGDPMIKIDRYILFIKLPEGKKLEKGDKVKVKVTKVNPAVGFTELTE